MVPHCLHKVLLLHVLHYTSSPPFEVCATLVSRDCEQHNGKKRYAERRGGGHTSVARRRINMGRPSITGL